MIRVLIIDDHAIVRRGLSQILSEQDDISVTAEAGSGAEAMEVLEKEKIDVALLDVHLPGISGLDLLQLIRREFPGVGILILTIFPEEQYAFRAIKLGASGYLTKDSNPSELIDAIRKIAAGGKYITSGLAEKLAVYLEKSAEKPPHETLSLREYQVFCALASGYTVGQIAEERCLSVKTISTYRARILQKMKMSSNADLNRYALQHRLIG